MNYPTALLLDEPLGALDLKLRQAMQIELKRIQREVGITFVFVTHDQEEALTMCDRIAVMSEGTVEQIGTPEEIYERPASVFVAGFIGTANLLPVTVAATAGRRGHGRSSATAPGPRPRDGTRLRRGRLGDGDGAARAAAAQRRPSPTAAPACRPAVTDLIFQGPVGAGLAGDARRHTARRPHRRRATNACRCCGRATACGSAGRPTPPTCCPRRPTWPAPPAPTSTRSKPRCKPARRRTT